MDRDPHPGVPPDGPDAPLSEAEARRVLARAAERERAWSAGVPVARLRDAAVEAGISAAAFDAALAEARLKPAAGARVWRRAVAAVLGVALVLGAGVAAVQRGGAGAVPSAPPLAGAPPALAGPAAGAPTGALTCAPPDGVPAERLSALAAGLYPEVLAPDNQRRGVVVALLFDAGCHLQAHALSGRAGERLDAEATLGRLFPAAGRARLPISGIADVGPSGGASGAPWVVWGMLPPPR
jgi:hypothetical protein